MTIPFLAEGDRLAEFQRAVRDQFAKGGSLRDFLILWGAVIAFVVFCRVLWRLQQRLSGAIQPNQPWGLFEKTLKRLGLPRLERRCLRSMARGAGLKHPTTLLLAPVLFDHAAATWMTREGRPRGGADGDERMIIGLRDQLFPKDGLGSSS